VPSCLPLTLPDKDTDVCLHSLRILQSLLLEEDVGMSVGPGLLDSPCLEHVRRLTSRPQPALRQAACDTLEDIEALLRKFGKTVCSPE